MGEKEGWKIKLHSSLGFTGTPEEAEERIQKEQKALLARYTAILVTAVLLSTAAFLSQDSSPLPQSFMRPPYGEENYRMPLEAEVHWQEVRFKERINVNIGSKELNREEKEQMLLRFAGELPERIKGENESLDRVCFPLNLINRDEKTGIAIRWFSQVPGRISERGELDPIGLQKPMAVSLMAELRLGELEKEVFLTPVLIPGRQIEVQKQALSRRVEEALSHAEDTGKEELLLPERLRDGVRISYEKPREGQWAAILVLSMALCLWVFQDRYRSMEKESMDRRSAMRREFPELVSQMVLLLNAGLVVTAAFLELAEQSGGEDMKKDSPLFYELSQVAKRIRRSNGSFTGELMTFAQASGVRELVRFASIVGDNIDKGSSLSHKLEQESSFLREQQRRITEEACRTAETKLTFPLVILLLVLIMIAVAPVMLEM